jgi:hypothetical protein
MEHNLKCTLCNYVFATPSSLKRHQKTQKRLCAVTRFVYPPPGWSIANDDWDSFAMQKRDLTAEQRKSRKNYRNRLYYWTTV